jgi:type II secretory pathway pseudopilin PulG
MNRTKRVLFFCQIAAITCLMPLTVLARAEKKDSSAVSGKEKRLVLFPQTHLQLPAAPVWGDSVEAVVTVAVPDSCKNQRYVCWFEMNGAMRLSTVPRYKWAFRRDSLMVLSAIPLQIRVARQTLTSSKQPLFLKIHYQNLDHAAKLSGVAVIDLLPDKNLAPILPAKIDSTAAAISPIDSLRVALAQSPAAPAIGDSTATAAGARAFGVFYVALAILLIILFGGLSWLMTWSQRRHIQKFEAKAATMAFSQLQHHQTSGPPLAAHDHHTANDVVAAQNGFTESQHDLPAVDSNEKHFELTAISSQLHELHLSLQQVLANQREAKQRLAQITAVAALTPPKSPVRVALFDILNNDAALPNSGHDTNANSSPRLRIQLADNCRTDGVAVEVAASASVSIALQSGAPNNGVAFNFGAASKLRILFADSEFAGGAHDEILLH